MEGKTGGWILYFVLIGAVLVVGWNQPLRHRFLSPEQLAAIQKTETGPHGQTTTGRTTNWRPQGTSLNHLPSEPGK